MMNQIKIQCAKIINTKLFEVLIVSLICLNVLCIVIGTFDNAPVLLHKIISALELISIVIFTIEYALRIWVSTSRIKHLLSASAIIDLLAILPFYIPFIIPVDLRVLRLFRLFRLVRILKINRYSDALSSVLDVIKRKRHQLVSSIAIVLLLMLTSSIVIYGVEHEAQPEVFKNALSGMWWSIATLTTVGYGDIYPVTALGKLFSAVIALLGIGLVAVPTGIISSGFVERIENNSKNGEPETKHCPHCGNRLK